MNCPTCQASDQHGVFCRECRSLLPEEVKVEAQLELVAVAAVVESRPTPQWWQVGGKEPEPTCEYVSEASQRWNALTDDEKDAAEHADDANQQADEWTDFIHECPDAATMVRRGGLGNKKVSARIIEMMDCWRRAKLDPPSKPTFRYGWDEFVAFYPAAASRLTDPRNSRWAKKQFVDWQHKCQRPPTVEQKRELTEFIVADARPAGLFPEIEDVPDGHVVIWLGTDGELAAWITFLLSKKRLEWFERFLWRSKSRQERMAS